MAVGDDARFNPRAREGRDDRKDRKGLLHRSFNPRAREGRDGSANDFVAQQTDVSIHAPARGATGIDLGGAGFGSVSIHAPARGATWQWIREMARAASFNPRAREGRDARRAARHPCCAAFQSTRPRGARPAGDEPRGGL